MAAVPIELPTDLDVLPLPFDRIAQTSASGDSGAPLYTLIHGTPHLAGMVVGMHRQTDHSVSAFEERTSHTPLGLAIVVQAGVVTRTLGKFWK